MRIIRNEEEKTWTLVPVEDGEAETLAAMIAILKLEDKLSYGGRERDGDGDEFCAVHLHAGGREEKRIETNGNVTVHSTVHVDGIELILRGSAEEDKNEVGRIRDTCYFGSGSLIFIGETEVNGKKSIVTTSKRCKHCGVKMIQLVACEWNTCDACAAKCEHHYVKGAVHGGGTDIGVGKFCDICGRGKPRPEGEREKSIIEHHLEVEKELGIPVFHDVGETPFVSSQEIVKASRLARRHKKSLQRSVSA